jgi:6-phosphogluconolactonase
VTVVRTLETARGRVEIHPDAAAVASACATRFVAAAAHAAERGQSRFVVALAGGSTPKAAYRLLATRERDAVDWSRVVVVFGDERCVPPDHADSNYRMAKEALLDQVAIPLDNIYRIEAELAPAMAAERYDSALRRLLGPAPTLDLCLLGMGPDGHTASLFPGSSALAERSALCVATHAPSLGVDRITLTWPVLSSAREVVVSTPGAEKADALATALVGPPGSVPIQLVQAPPDRMTWLVDEAAAARLPTTA